MSVVNWTFVVVDLVPGAAALLAPGDPPVASTLWPGALEFDWNQRSWASAEWANVAVAAVLDADEAAKLLAEKLAIEAENAATVTSLEP